MYAGYKRCGRYALLSNHLTYFDLSPFKLKEKSLLYHVIFVDFQCASSNELFFNNMQVSSIFPLKIYSFSDPAHFATPI